MLLFSLPPPLHTHATFLLDFDISFIPSPAPIAQMIHLWWFSDPSRPFWFSSQFPTHTYHFQTTAHTSGDLAGSVPSPEMLLLLTLSTRLLFSLISYYCAPNAIKIQERPSDSIRGSGDKEDLGIQNSHFIHSPDMESAPTKDSIAGNEIAEHSLVLQCLLRPVWGPDLCGVLGHRWLMKNPSPWKAQCDRGKETLQEVDMATQNLRFGQYSRVNVTG